MVGEGALIWAKGKRMTVEELRVIVKIVMEHPDTPEKLKDPLDFILGFLDGVIERKDLGQIRGFEVEV